MKKTLTTIALSILCLLSFAQQDVQYSMNTFNRLSVNPAYAGMNRALCATLFYRQQWTSFPGAPKTVLLSVDYGQILNGGLGLTIDQDQLGFEKTLKAKMAYSYHLPLAGGVLGIGLDAGIIQKSLNGNFISPDGSTSNSGGGVDPSIPWNGFSATTYDVGFGLYYQTRRLYLGLSSLHLPEQQFKEMNKKYTEARHYYLMAGYTFIMPNPTWELTPSVLLKSVASSSQLDANLMLKWNKIVFIGASYRMSDAAIAMAGVEKPVDQKKKITAKLGLAYDMTLSNIYKQSSGTYEIMLGFCYKIKPDGLKTSHQNVRFL